MIFGIGTDIIEVKRMEKSLLKNDALMNKLYTKAEQDYCNKGTVTKYQCFAARFAAKEAFFKALGTGFRYGMAFHEIEVLNDELGKPYVSPQGKVKDYLNEQGIKTIHLSISHLKEIANALVVLER
ncbi:MAG: holo-ACP synthase [Bacteroidales bacterium]|jgi:holo-[acyl-carrier protein] synthase|nr:ACP synthase [Lentimicrobiaceae bacterium]MDG1135703.1 holo-ACP synthase [Bacteroidales bacterium]MDG1901882.1 holo-ACP synthase [Bacteroidales bacterium]MDG2081027.1 holo-ACP synthase [Bacteroidales bacterium]|tara:strand:- start:7468 stop:7845 length:378 start_codon:yes stop_codon:yes gene_type:complete